MWNFYDKIFIKSIILIVKRKYEINLFTVIYLQ